MNNKLEVIGIDHGWSMMKTVTQVFVTGVKEITTTPALFGDVLEYDGKYYKIGTVRQEVKDTKVEDDSFYLLTLAAVAKELKKRGLSDAKVFLAVGLPLTRFGAERNNFIKYLTKNKRVDFRYENEAYHIEIDDVAVFPQCYAAVVDKIPTMAKKTLVVDIGSWTIDIMPVINKSPDESKCVTVPRAAGMFGRIAGSAHIWIDPIRSAVFAPAIPDWSTNRSAAGNPSGIPSCGFRVRRWC